MRKFKNMQELNEYIEWEAILIVDEPEYCHICNEPLKDEVGWDQYYLAEDYSYEKKFCSEECLRQFLVENYLEEER